MSAYADDLLVAHSKDMIVASLQPEVDKVVAWSDKARLTHNTFKCEKAFFSLDGAEAAWQPNIIFDGKQMFCNPFPIFLGVRYDWQLKFGEHVPKLCQSMSGCINPHRALGSMTWGMHTSDCRQVYIATVHCMLEYVNAAWAPWLPATATIKLEKVQLEAIRAASGLVHSMSVEAVLVESQLPTISTRFQTISLQKADE